MCYTSPTLPTIVPSILTKPLDHTWISKIKDANVNKTSENSLPFEIKGHC